MTTKNPIKTTDFQGVMIGTGVAALVIIFFVIFAELNPNLLHKLSREDAPIENLTAVLYGISTICFLIMAQRSSFLRQKDQGLRFAAILSWALLCFFIMGEEISWGQRIFNFQTPDELAVINVQSEFNIHNLAAFNDSVGGHYRMLSVMMLTIGVLIPLISLTKMGRNTLYYFAYPIAPLNLWLFFIGGYIYGQYYYTNQADRFAPEVRELIFAIGIFGYSLQGMIRPCILLKCCNKLKNP